MAEHTDYDLEHYKATNAIQQMEHKNRHEKSVEMFRAVLETGHTALKSSFLLNGGASLAMLAFIGHLAKVDPSKMPEFAICIFLFTVGAFMVSVATGGRYLGQSLFAEMLESKHVEALERKRVEALERKRTEALEVIGIEALEVEALEVEALKIEAKKRRKQIEKYYIWGTILKWFSVVFVIVSYIAFFYGMTQTYFAFANFSFTTCTDCWT